MIPKHLNDLHLKEQTFMVGGSVRDLLLGHRPKDFDLVFSGDAGQYARDLATTRNGRFVSLGRGDKAVYRVVFKGYHLDITAMRGDSIGADLALRDFTINAMAIPLCSGGLIDNAGGQKDLKHKRIRMVTPSVFHDDPVRVLRAHRLSSLLDFEIEPGTLEAMAQHVRKITASAGERLREELILTLQPPHSYRQIGLMMKIGTLAALLPGAPWRLLNQKVREKAPRQAILSIYAVTESLLNTHSHWLLFPETEGKKNRSIPHPALFKLAVLLYETGRGFANNGADKTKTTEFTQEWTAAINQRLRLSNAEYEHLRALIRGFGEIAAVIETRGTTKADRRKVFRFFQKNKKTAPSVILHAYASAKLKSASSRDIQADNRLSQYLENLAKAYKMEFIPLSGRPPLMTGGDLIRRFHLSPSPGFKRILAHVELSRLCGEIRNKNEAISLVESLLAAPSDL